MDAMPDVGEGESKLDADHTTGEYTEQDFGDDEQGKEIYEAKKQIQTTEQQISRINKFRPKDRETIKAQRLDIKADWKVPFYHKSPEQIKFLQNALQGNFIFSDLTSTELDELVGAMQEEVVTKQTYIIRQGDTGDYFYIVGSGAVSFVKDDEQVGKCRQGESFGELALLYNCPRVVSCIAATSTVTLWKVDQNTFRQMLARHTEATDSDVIELLRKIAIFQKLDDRTLNQFVQSMTVVHYDKGKRIVQKGDQGNIFYIVREGQVKVHDIGLGDSKFEEQILTAGHWFGERALLTGEPRVANVTAMTDVVTLAMDRETFEQSIGPLKVLMEHEMRKTFLKGLSIFARGNVTNFELDELVDLIQEVEYPKDTKLSEAGKPYEMKLWVIRHGRLVVSATKVGKVYNLQSGDHFGDKSVRGDIGHISSHTAIVEENLTAWVLTRQGIESVIGDIERLGHAQPFVTDAQDQSIQLSDLTRVRILGVGAFGKVWLVHDNNKNGYALKAISKLKLIESQHEGDTVRESEMLRMLEHPFILRLVSTFQDPHHVYLLFPLIPGGELFSVLHKKKERGRGLPNATASFYAACIVEAIGHFHQRNIAYRDLKLENVLIDGQGFCVVVDLGFAKVIEGRTYTLVGTPEYLAPEIIMSKGHGTAVDYWAYGVLVYELLVGFSPFFKRGSSQIDMFKRIVLVDYDTPGYVHDAADAMISQLLVRRASKRLGNLANGYLDIKNHVYFQESQINFKSLLRKEAMAPWVPEIKNSLDSSNFDDFSAEENDDDIGRPLTPEEQRLFQGF